MSLGLTRRSSVTSPKLGDLSEENQDQVGFSDNGGGEGGGTSWSRHRVSSGLLFGFWAGLVYYVYQLPPSRTPYQDKYILLKLLNLAGDDDGIEMNKVLVALWYLMGLWPLVYSMLLIPTGRSSRSKVHVWPFLVLSFFGGAYVLIPYFVLWRPPSPPIKKEEIRKWPLKFLESRITAVITLGAGLGLIGYAALAGGDAWKEFYQSFIASKFIHAMSIDFTLLSTFAPFWVYNDMTARRWTNKGSWLVPVSLVPLVGPALYILLRPSLSSLQTGTLEKNKHS